MVNILLSLCNFKELWIRNNVKEYVNSSKTVAVIPFSFSKKHINSSRQWLNAYGRECGKYYDEIVSPFLDLGVKENNIIFLNYFDDSESEMKKKIEKCDVIYLTGGLADKAVERIIKKNLLESIKKSSIVMGSSEGALMQLDEYYISPGDEYDKFNYYKGLGLIRNKSYIEVNYECSRVQHESIKRALKEKTDTIYAMSNIGGMIVDGSNVRLMGDVMTYSKIH